MLLLDGSERRCQCEIYEKKIIELYQIFEIITFYDLFHSSTYFPRYLPASPIKIALLKKPRATPNANFDSFSRFDAFR